MALTNAEKVRRYKERKREEVESRSKPNLNDLRKPFFESAESNANWSSFTLPLELAGIEAPKFADDRGPEAYADQDAMAGLDEPFAGYTGSIGRAEIMVGSLIDAASELAGIINSYKKGELTARIAEIEAADLSDPITRKAALADMVRLTKMLDQLQKQVRWTFPQWKVTG